MPRLYAAIKMKMGAWDYYSVKMKMSEAASEIQFATEVHDDKTLDTMIQRELKKSRAGTHIVNYLVKNEERFFNSLVVAALDGNPVFNPISIEDKPEFRLIANRFVDTFGVLTFDDTIKTYALDGQHRLYSIKKLLGADSDTPPPPGFSDETINVIFVVPKEESTRDDFLKSYRRLFSSLNRHAKSTQAHTNIIMDEDDRFAIATRRLFSDAEFFKWDGNEANPRIDTNTASTNLNRSSVAWATLVGLYTMNITLLWDEEYSLEHGQYKSNHVIFQAQPTDEEVDNLFSYLDNIWDAIVTTLPVLKEEPAKKRLPPGSDDTSDNRETEDNLLFRPIGQTLILAPLARRLMNNHSITINSEYSDMLEALSPLKYIDWNLQSFIWKGLLSVLDPATNQWKMRSEERAACVKQGLTVLLWVTGIENLNGDQVDELQADWGYHLSPQISEENQGKLFDQLAKLRERIIKECY